MQDHEGVTDYSVRISGPRLSYQLAFKDDDDEATDQFEDILGQLCIEWAAQHPAAVATLVLKHDTTCDFPRFASWSFWMTVIGDNGLARYLVERARKLFANLEARVEMAIGDGAQPRIHVRDGQVWKPFDGANWATIAPESMLDRPNHGRPESDFDGDATDSKAGHPRHSVKSARSRTVRADARVGSVVRKIEEAYGLPAGSVKLVKPDGNPLRADALIRTLREHWD